MSLCRNEWQWSVAVMLINVSRIDMAPNGRADREVMRLGQAAIHADTLRWLWHSVSTGVSLCFACIAGTYSDWTGACRHCCRVLWNFDSFLCERGFYVAAIREDTCLWHPLWLVTILLHFGRFYCLHSVHCRDLFRLKWCVPSLCARVRFSCDQRRRTRDIVAGAISAAACTPCIAGTHSSSVGLYPYRIRICIVCLHTCDWGRDHRCVIKYDSAIRRHSIEACLAWASRPVTRWAMGGHSTAGIQQKGNGGRPHFQFNFLSRIWSFSLVRPYSVWAGASICAPCIAGTYSNLSGACLQGMCIFESMFFCVGSKQAEQEVVTPTRPGKTNWHSIIIQKGLRYSSILKHRPCVPQPHFTLQWNNLVNDILSFFLQIMIIWSLYSQCCSFHLSKLWTTSFIQLAVLKSIEIWNLNRDACTDSRHLALFNLLYWNLNRGRHSAGLISVSRAQALWGLRTVQTESESHQHTFIACFCFC